MLQQAFTIFLVVMTLTTKCFAASWNSTQFSTEMGTVLSGGKDLRLAPNDNGQILLSVPVNQLNLDDNYRVSFKFVGKPPSQIFVIWRTDSSQELYQKKFRPMGKSQPSIDMTGIEGWTGTTSSLKFGFLAHAGQQIALLQASASEPGITDHVKEVLENWSAFRAWIAADVNVYTGTPEFSSGPYPAQIFAGLTLALILFYVALMRKKANWQGAAVIIFCAWLALDSFWQLQLWRQVGETRAQYSGMSSHEKLLASEDAPFVHFADAARPLITGPDARVFIAGSSDYQTMVSAYYMSPANTFWHRHGPELPDAKYLRTGDYIVLLRASKINYQAALGTIKQADGKQLKVREHMSDRVGALLELL